MEVCRCDNTANIWKNRNFPTKLRDHNCVGSSGKNRRNIVPASTKEGIRHSIVRRPDIQNGQDRIALNKRPTCSIIFRRSIINGVGRLQPIGSWGATRSSAFTTASFHIYQTSQFIMLNSADDTELPDLVTEIGSMEAADARQQIDQLVRKMG